MAHGRFLASSKQVIAMMKIDMHFHTMLSKDSAIPLTALAAKIIHEKGLQGIAVTDHNTCKGISRLLQIFNKFNLTLIPAEEIKTPGGGEVLCYFIQEEIPRGSLGEILDAARDQDAITVLAHPVDYIRGNWSRLLSNPRELKKIIPRLDGIEVFNSRNYSPRGNWMAFRTAREYDLLGVAGSDAHNLFEIGTTFTKFECQSNKLDDLHACMKHKEISPVSRERILKPISLILPTYKSQRFVFGLVKKLHSALNSVLPPFKRWQQTSPSFINQNEL